MTRTLWLSLCLLLLASSAAADRYPVELVYQPGGPVQSVHLAGDFNDWSTDSHPLTRVSNGRWQIRLELSAGVYPYKFVIDGERWITDPRARERRSDGHGGENSLLEVGPIERAMKRFRTPEWVADGIAYQIFPDRFFNGNEANDPRGRVSWQSAPTFGNFFGGDLEGVLQKLDYLEDLGVTVLYLNPIFLAGSNHKYDPIDHRQVDPHFGGDEAFEKLLAEAHRRDMRVVLDGVFNHTNRRFFAFQDCVAQGKASKYWDWYFIEGDSVRLDPPNYACWHDHASLPELNTENPEVLAWLMESVEKWLAAGVDGWRLDTVTDIEHPFFEALRDTCKEHDADVWLLGEIWGDPWSYLQGDELDSATNYRFRDAVLKGVIERSIDGAELAARLEGIQEDLPAPARPAMMNLLGSHDTPRIRSLAHEQAGAVRGDARLRQAIALQMVFPGLPCVYYGDEVGLEGGEDPDNRRGFPWARVANSELHRYTRGLIELRKRLPALRSPAWRTVRATKHEVVIVRGQGRHTAAVILNLTDEARTISFSPGRAGWKRGTVIEALSGRKLRVTARPWPLELGPSAVAILTR